MAYKMITCFQTNILQRYMNEKQLKEFLDTYISHCYRRGGRAIKEPNANDLRIASHLRKTKSYKETANALGINLYKVESAMQRVAAWSK